MIKQVTNDKLLNGGTIIIVSKSIYEEPLEMEDMESIQEVLNEETLETTATVSYHSLKTLAQEHPHWSPSELKINDNEYLKFHYCLGGDFSERPKFGLLLESLGLVSGRKIPFTEWSGKEYMICSHIEIKDIMTNYADKEETI